jgi:hypothetical protein
MLGKIFSLDIGRILGLAILALLLFLALGSANALAQKASHDHDHHLDFLSPFKEKAVSKPHCALHKNHQTSGLCPHQTSNSKGKKGKFHLATDCGGSPFKHAAIQLNQNHTALLLEILVFKNELMASGIWSFESPRFANFLPDKIKPPPKLHS